MKLFLRDGVSLVQGSDCLVALPSTGNVGQLAADCIVSTLSSKGLLERVGCIESALVMPMVGYDQLSPQEGTKLCLPIEVYVVRQTNTVLVLQRSLCVKGAQRMFCEQLLQLIRTQLGCKSAVILSGASTEDIEPASCGNLFAVASSSAAKDQLTSTYPVLAASLRDNTFATSIVLPAVSTLAQMVATADYNNDNSMYGTRQPVAAVSSVFSALQVGDSQNTSGVAKEVIAQALCEVLPRGMTAARCFLESLFFSSQSAGSTGDSVPLNVVVLGKICAEGDNIRDGVQLAVEVMYSLGLVHTAGATGEGVGEGAAAAKLKVEEVSLPASWAHKYGAPLRGQASDMFY